MKSMSMESAQRLLEGHPNLMSIREASEALCCNPRTVYRLVDEGTIECTRIGRKIVISKDTICAYLCRPVAVGNYRQMENSKYEKELLDADMQTAKAPEKVEPDDDEWRALKSAAEKLGYESVLARAYNIVKRGIFVGFGSPNSPFEQIPREKWGEIRNCGKKTLELLYEAFPEKAI